MYLSKPAQYYYDSIQSEAIDFRQTDKYLLGQLCETLAELNQLNKLIESLGENFFVAGQRGTLVPHPSLQRRDKLNQQLMQMNSKLVFNPLERLKLPPQATKTAKNDQAFEAKIKEFLEEI